MKEKLKGKRKQAHKLEDFAKKYKHSWQSGGILSRSYASHIFMQYMSLTEEYFQKILEALSMRCVIF